MIKQKIKVVSAALPLLASALFSPATFATDNNYGIIYRGGDDLGASNVQIDPTLINALSPLVIEDNINVTISNSSKWQTGYIRENDIIGCRKYNYVRVSANETINPEDNVSFTIKDDKYSAKVDINAITLENFVGEGRFVNVGVKGGGGLLLFTGFRVFTDATCTTDIPDYDKQGLKVQTNDERVFIEMHAELSKNGQRYNKNGIYFGITDIDSAQSYKILNENNKLTPENMYAKAAEDLQNASSPLKNKYVAGEGNDYIYSQYQHQYPYINSVDTAHIYVPISKETQTAGLDFVFGFAHNAGSSIEYYARQLKVNYTSDNKGTIKGISTEKVIEGDNPSGSLSPGNKGYGFKHWICDKNVTLDDGTVIKAGDPITSDQVKQIAIREDITFTAIHDKIPSAPDTGSMTDTDGPSATIIQISAVALSLVTVLAFCLARLSHKKIDFEK